MDLGFQPIAGAPLAGQDAGNGQYLRPALDVSFGSWVPSSGSSLRAMLDEVSPDDADYIRTDAPSTAEVRLAAGGDPETDAAHVINYRAAGRGSLTVSLVQGSTVIASHMPTLGTSMQTFSFGLTSAQADAITDYTDLRLRFVAA